MKVSLRVFMVAVLATVFIFSAIHFRSPPDPSTQGRLASEWAADLLSNDYAVRGDAQSALKQLRDDAVAQLCVLLRKRNAPWEKHVVRLNSLLPFFNYQTVDAVACRLRSAEMLGLLGPDATAAIPDLISALAFDPSAQEPERALLRIGRDSIGPLTHALQNASHAKIRERSARLLREFSSLADDSVAVLMEATQDRIPAVREEAALSLGAVARKREDAVKPLLALRSDSAEGVRSAALKALGEIGVPKTEVLNALQRGLADKSVGVQLAAARSLWSLAQNSSDTVPVLTNILLGYERRWDAAYALAEIGPEASPAVPALVKVLTQEQISRPFRTPPSSAFALGKIGPAAIPALSQLLTNNDSRVRTSALLAFGFMGRSATNAVPCVLEMLRDNNVEVRHTAALTLPALGAKHEQVVAGLADCLRDEDIFIRSAAAAILRQIVPEQDWVVQPE
jgi:HEAT repeat protein